MEEERREREKRKTPQNCRSPSYRQRFITIVKSVIEYTHTKYKKKDGFDLLKNRSYCIDNNNKIKRQLT